MGKHAVDAEDYEIVDDDELETGSEDDGSQTEHEVELKDDSEETLEVEEGIEPESQHDAKAKPENRPPKRNRKTFDERIREITYQRNVAEENAAAARAALELKEREIEELRQSRGSTTSQSEDPLAREERELLEKRKHATDEDDLFALNEINDKLSDVRIRRALSARQVSQVSDAVRPQTQNEPPSGRHPAAEDWIKQNEWFTKDENQHLTKEVLRIESDLMRQGYPMGPELYAKLDERLRHYPDFDGVLYSRSVDERGHEPNTRRRSVVASPSRGGNGGARRSGGNKLSEYDISSMRMAKLDPTNEKHVAAYMKYRR